MSWNMKCELCDADLTDETAVGGGEFFVCENCADVGVARAALDEPTMTLDELRTEIETKH